MSGKDFLRTLETSGDDFSGTSGTDPFGMIIPVVFQFGMSDGSMVCANVSLSMDGLIECEENFTVELTLDTVKDSLSLGANTVTVVTLQDSDGKCSELLSKHTLNLIIL